MQRLKEMPKIIILDLSGNLCSATPSGGGGGDDDKYRLFVIYNVRKLKVRMGSGVSKGAALVCLNLEWGGAQPLLLAAWRRRRRRCQ